MRAVRKLCALALLAARAAAVTITSNPASVPASFDYIVVGGGTGGLTVASRLTENPNITVLVVEAGPDATLDPRVTDPEQEIAAVFAFSFFWPTVPQTIGGMSQTIVTGKLMGGGSSINGMQYSKGTIGQYNDWGLLGSPGWNWVNMQSCMKKAEMFHVPTASQVAQGAYYDPLARGFHGPVDTGYPYPGEGYISYNDYQNATLNAYPGLPFDSDLGSGSPRGADRFTFTINPANVDPSGTNVRSDSSSAYVYPFLSSRPNLYVLVNNTADHLTWNTAPLLKRATGVITQPSAGGSPTTFNVTQEVIVASGAIASPAFLERSGVGDPAVLNPLNISVVVSLPSIGTNMQDQAYTLHQYQAVPGLNSSVNGTTNQPGYGAVSFLSVQDLLGSAAATTFLNNLSSTVPARAAAAVAAGAFTSVAGLRAILRLQVIELRAGAPAVELSFNAGGTPGQFSNLAWVLTPQSRGYSHITGTSPFALPNLNPRYLIEPSDQQLEGAAAAASRLIFNESPLNSLWNVETVPGLATVPANATQADWTTWAKATYASVLHPVGTIAMLPRLLGGSVDPQLRVYGTANVRVADASIIPTELSAHLQMTVYGIAEMAAMMIASGSGPGAC